jgi:hypothetical protein
VPTTLILGISGYFYWQRRTYLSDPILQRGLAHLTKDQRVTDFCGESIKPGWIITKNKRAGENWVQYKLSISGTSGKLSTTLIGDFLNHEDLLELE